MHIDYFFLYQSNKFKEIFFLLGARRGRGKISIFFIIRDRTFKHKYHYLRIIQRTLKKKLPGAPQGERGQNIFIFLLLEIIKHKLSIFSYSSKIFFFKSISENIHRDTQLFKLVKVLVFSIFFHKKKCLVFEEMRLSDPPPPPLIFRVCMTLGSLGRNINGKNSN